MPRAHLNTQPHVTTEQELEQALECLAKNSAHLDLDLQRLREDVERYFRTDPIAVSLEVALLGPMILLTKLVVASGQRSVRQQLREAKRRRK